MDHQKVISENYVDRYLRDELAPEETDMFEQHYLSCNECLNELAGTQRLRDGLKDLVDAGELELPEITMSRAAWWHSPTWAVAATTLLAVSLVTTGAMYQNLRSLADRGAGTVEIYSLVAVRSGPNDPPVNMIRADAATDTLVLLVETGQLDGTGPYSATLSSESGSTKPRTFEPLHPGFDGMLTVAITTDRLEADDYRIEVRQLGNNSILNQVRFRLEDNR